MPVYRNVFVAIYMLCVAGTEVNVVSYCIIEFVMRLVSHSVYPAWLVFSADCLAGVSLSLNNNICFLCLLNSVDLSLAFTFYCMQEFSYFLTF